MKEIKHEPRNFSEIIEALPIIKLKLKKADLGPFAELQGKEVVDYKLYL